MWKFKGCPRCKGDLYLEKDTYGWYEECLQCGYMKDLQSQEVVLKTMRDYHKKDKQIERDNKKPVFVNNSGA
ncbi:MAG: hypothetical protein NTV30_06355 [Chloroflexi bacterium]|nr:hypothetical protein [Chloroflexota bacterium]